MEAQSKGYSVVVSNKATKMLVSHVAFLAQASSEAATLLAADLQQAMDSLRDMPQRCPFLRADHLPHNKYRKLLANKQYLLLYQIIDETVYIDYVIDTRQDYEWLIK